MLYRCPCEKIRLQCGFVKCCWRCDAIGWVWFRQQISFASPTLLSLKVPSTSREIRLCRQVHPVYSATNFTYLDKLLMYIGLYGIKTHGTSIFVILQWVKGIYIYFFFFLRSHGKSSLTRKTILPSSPLLLFLLPETHTMAKLSHPFSLKMMTSSNRWRSAVWGKFPNNRVKVSVYLERMCGLCQKSFPASGFTFWFLQGT